MLYRSNLRSPTGVALLCLSATVVVLAGCGGGPKRVAAPKLNPSEAAEAALEAYDADGDGAIAGAELNKVPSLKSGLAQIDKNGDKRIDAEEIENRVASMVKNRIGRMTMACAILMNGQPLSGATVSFEPEPFLGEAIKPATGTTERTGIARMTIEGAEKPSMMVGYYKVRISRKDASGKETLPARYNTKSILGQEVAQDSPALIGGPIQFNLTGK